MFDTSNLRLRISSLVVGAAVAASAVSVPTAAGATPDSPHVPGGSAAVIGEDGARVILGDTAHNPALRTTEKVGGGVWIYGIGGGYAYSYYDHGSKEHRATACSRTACAKTGWVPKKKRAAAKALRTAGGNTAYWAVKS